MTTRDDNVELMSPPRRQGLCYFLLAFLATFCQGGLLPAQDLAEDPVTIVLFPRGAVDDTLVSLRHVARLSGGSAAARQRLEKLDIADFGLDAGQLTIGGEQVRFRLLLAGFSAASFRLEGARRIVVTESDEALSLRKLLGSAEQALRQRCGGDITATPRPGVIVPALYLRGTDQLRVEARVKTPAPYARQAQVDVAIQVNGSTREVVPVTFDLAQREPPPKKHAFSGQGALLAPRGSDSKDIVIKSRDNVKIVANVGSARIEATGLAEQDGQIGQVIRVRNVESNRVVHGRVEAGGIVVVDY